MNMTLTPLLAHHLQTIKPLSSGSVFGCVSAWLRLLSVHCPCVDDFSLVVACELACLPSCLSVTFGLPTGKQEDIDRNLISLVCSFQFRRLKSGRFRVGCAGQGSQPHNIVACVTLLKTWVCAFIGRYVFIFDLLMLLCRVNKVNIYAHVTLKITCCYIACLKVHHT